MDVNSGKQAILIVYHALILTMLSSVYDNCDAKKAIVHVCVEDFYELHRSGTDDMCLW